MAFYEYTCKLCESSVTVARGITDEEKIPVCVSCENPLNRVYSSIGVTFNGGGFYSTDK
jgi:putative FmdB family regulatory protein